MRIAAIHIYPVKSCRGIALQTAEVDALGLAGDRRFMIVEAVGPAAGKFLTQRTHPRMALIETSLTQETLTLRAPAFSPINIPRRAPAPPPAVTVEIWEDQNLVAENCGDGPAEWLSAYLETPVRLVRIGEKFHRPVKPSRAQPCDKVSFADGDPLLVISESSLAALNARLATRGEPPITMDRFRPNLILSGSDCPAHIEDTAAHLRIGAITLRAAGPCARCIITTTDQQTAARGHEPLRTLATYRRDAAEPTKINFGQNYINETKNGLLRTGDTVTIFQ